MANSYCTGAKNGWFRFSGDPLPGFCALPCRTRRAMKRIIRTLKHSINRRRVQGLHTGLAQMLAWKLKILYSFLCAFHARLLTASPNCKTLSISRLFSVIICSGRLLNISGYVSSTFLFSISIISSIKVILRRLNDLLSCMRASSSSSFSASAACLISVCFLLTGISFSSVHSSAIKAYTG